MGPRRAWPSTIVDVADNFRANPFTAPGSTFNNFQENKPDKMLTGNNVGGIALQ